MNMFAMKNKIQPEIEESIRKKHEAFKKTR
jgi:hypothetical protein